MNDEYLLKRLEDRSVCSPAHNSCRNDWACEEAAARIRQQAARIAELEAALDETNEIMLAATLGEHELTKHIEGADDRKKARVAHFRKVRAALKREG